MNDIFTWWNFLQLTAIATVALLPGILRKREPKLTAAAEAL
jgi:hypothetical protein